MRVEEAAVEITIDPDQTDEFVDRLVSDEEFRRALEERPAETLAEYDISVSPDLLARRVELPPPEDVEQARAAMDTGEFSSAPRGNAIFDFFRKFRILKFSRD